MDIDTEVLPHVNGDRSEELLFSVVRDLKLFDPRVTFVSMEVLCAGCHPSQRTGAAMGRIIVFLLCALTVLDIACSQTRGMREANIHTNGQRVALVIGNSSYSIGPLRNPIHDAQAVALALRQAGFRVLTFNNLNQKEMKRAIRSFGSSLVSGGVALFYYSGHGVQIKGSNYLIPINADIRNEGDVELEAVDANYVLNEMDAAKSRINIVILDACRNDPLPRLVRSTTRGLAQMNAPAGTIIAFSTSPGSVASDGSGENGLYTQEFVKNVTTPGLPVETVFKRTLSGVKQLSGGSQIPWTSYSIEGDFYFIPPNETESTVAGGTIRANTSLPSARDSSKGSISTANSEVLPNYALQFDGTSSYCEIGPASTLQPQQVTVELWVKFDHVNSAFIPLLAEKDTDHRTRANGFSLLYEQGKFVFRLAKAYDSGISVGAPYSPPISTWIDIAGTYDGHTMDLYVNGELLATQPFEGPAYYGSRAFCLGVGEHWSFGGVKHFRGQMDEVRVWNVARTQEEIKAVMYQRLSGKESGLVGYWNFDQTAQGMQIPDQTVNRNQAVAGGDAYFVHSDLF